MEFKQRMSTPTTQEVSDLTVVTGLSPEADSY